MPTKPEGPAQEPLNQCDGCRRGLPLDARGNHYNANSEYDRIGCTKHKYVATPAPSQPAGAREAAEEIARACAEFDGTTLPSWREYVKDRIAPLIAQQTAAKDAAIGRLERDLAQSIATGNENGEKAEYWCNTAEAAERERDSLREERDRARFERDDIAAKSAAEIAALKAGKDGKQ